MADVSPLTDADLAQLEKLLDRIPAPAEPLDVMMLDGFLCGVLLQPKPVPEGQWWRHVVDADGRSVPLGFNDEPLRALVRRRHAELEAAISERDWFDPWVFELDDDAEPLETVMPWVAGFATAMEYFPALMRSDSPDLAEPLAVLYRCFDPDDLEDADDLLALIEELEPPADLADAVESLVNSVLLLADVSRPLASTEPDPVSRATGRRASGAQQPRAPGRGGPRASGPAAGKTGGAPQGGQGRGGAVASSGRGAGAGKPAAGARPGGAQGAPSGGGQGDRARSGSGRSGNGRGGSGGGRSGGSSGGPGGRTH